MTHRALKEGAWYGGLRVVSQACSWAVTIAIARILRPTDYGLVAMATVLTGYIEIFNEMGLGAAIVQRKQVTEEELSSVFWFTLLTGFLFALAAWLLAYPTAKLFAEPRLVAITRTCALLFVISSMTSVPYSLLQREVRFREIGLIGLIASLVQTSAMLAMAIMGFGVWTLVGGQVIQRTMTSVLSFWRSSWWPKLHFRLIETRQMLYFGLNIAASRSVFYLFQRSDQFIIGKVFNAMLLGLYSLAFQLASIPTDKVVSIVQQVSFPVFSRMQGNPDESRRLYLKLNYYIALGVTPVYAAGLLFADPLIPILLGEKWRSIIPLFRMLCVMNFFLNISDLNNTVHTAQGRPRWRLYYMLVSVTVMPALILVAALYGFEFVGIPWITVFPLICVGWILISLRKLEIRYGEYLRIFAVPSGATMAMATGVFVLRKLPGWPGSRPYGGAAVLAIEILFAGAIFLVTVAVTDRRAFDGMMALVRPKLERTPPEEADAG
ncbi:MAG TPA: lipopolysaccharide biosynthesis protein [bacterium]